MISSPPPKTNEHIKFNLPSEQKTPRHSAWLHTNFGAKLTYRLVRTVFSYWFLQQRQQKCNKCVIRSTINVLKQSGMWFQNVWRHFHTLFRRSLSRRSAARSHTCRNLIRKLVISTRIKAPLQDLKSINTSFALFNASANAEFGSTGGPGGGGTLLNACIASAIFNTWRRKKPKMWPQGLMV